MKICGKCGKKFKTRVIINGKKRSLSSRKYCLSCSPFGKHNTKKICSGSEPKYGTKTIIRKCKKHGLTEYVLKTGRYYACKICRVEYVQKRRVKIKVMAVEYKGGKCIKCGYDKCIAALEFHHLDENKKDFSISKKGHCKSWESVKKELDKCVILCANCHRELHF